MPLGNSWANGFGGGYFFFSFPPRPSPLQVPYHLQSPSAKKQNTSEWMVKMLSFKKKTPKCWENHVQQWCWPPGCTRSKYTEKENELIWRHKATLWWMNTFNCQGWQCRKWSCFRPLHTGQVTLPILIPPSSLPTFDSLKFLMKRQACIKIYNVCTYIYNLWLRYT